MKRYIAFLIVSWLLLSSLVLIFQMAGQLDDREEQAQILATSLETQGDLCVALEAQYKAQYLDQIAELEDERDFYIEEARYWQERAAFDGIASGQTDRFGQFGSLLELEQWLADDPISERRAIPVRYDCDDFAIDLTLSALADGYWIGLGCTDTHMFNFTIIGNDIYRIEASQDRVLPWGMLD